jgi:hypothetical protein
VADRDHEVRADEDRDLAEFHRLGLVDVARGPEDDEECLAVAFEFRALVRLDRILDGQLVQFEVASQGRELLARRLVETNPCHRAVLLAGGMQLGEVIGLRRPAAVTVDGAVDDHVAVLAG